MVANTCDSASEQIRTWGPAGEDATYPQRYLRNLALRSGMKEDVFSIRQITASPASSVTDAEGAHFAAVKAALLDTMAGPEVR